ncbi:phytanoyl-CoA dioxygenase family protein [Tenacibaculum sp. SZ-18]|uniref:phytanoyl-CoA dioxygenase family protein n=1 Tax=Tenacibaculum sp. SZ-18 TaxID=754423 RepID=UPI001E34CAE6|nr:phytanoyl-CoA dioxygenase family protein [Tenacibaculum sp. SZ-18]
MINNNLHKNELQYNGFSISERIFSKSELNQMILALGENGKSFAVRQLVEKCPEILNLIFQNKVFKELYSDLCGMEYFLTKAIFFNKPKMSNWFVSYHQDLSISVKNKSNEEGFQNWTVKDNQLGVIPPKQILNNTVTMRIHLDRTDESNGALKVIPKSHSKGIIRIDESFKINNYEKEFLCEVEEGGVMIMKPLLLHASERSVSNFDRRVIHLEFCNTDVPMEWLEKKII